MEVVRPVNISCCGVVLSNRSVKNPILGSQRGTNWSAGGSQGRRKIEPNWSYGRQSSKRIRPNCSVGSNLSDRKKRKRDGDEEGPDGGRKKIIKIEASVSGPRSSSSALADPVPDKRKRAARIIPVRQQNCSTVDPQVSWISEKTGYASDPKFLEWARSTVEFLQKLNEESDRPQSGTDDVTWNGGSRFCHRDRCLAKDTDVGRKKVGQLPSSPPADSVSDKQNGRLGNITAGHEPAGSSDSRWMRLLPRARYLPDVDLYALPYTIPF